MSEKNEEKKISASITLIEDLRDELVDLLDTLEEFLTELHMEDQDHGRNSEDD